MSDNKHTMIEWEINNKTESPESLTSTLCAYALPIDQVPHKGIRIRSIATIWCANEKPTKTERETAELIARAPSLLIENEKLREEIKRTAMAFSEYTREAPGNMWQRAHGPQLSTEELYEEFIEYLKNKKP